jgi:hypothetical protein
LPQADPLLRVQPGGGLVQDQQLRVPQKGLSQLDPLPHTAGEASQASVGGVGEIDQLQQRPDLGPGLPGTQAAALVTLQRRAMGIVVAERSFRLTLDGTDQAD